MSNHPTSIMAAGATRCRAWQHGAPLALSALLLIAFNVAPARAQSYSIDWYKVAGGGGTSTGGTYTVSGTIGQPDAGQTLTGGSYSLTGGFWGLLAVVQTPGAPTLSIQSTSTNTAAVSWPYPSTGWVLQQNTNSVSSINWSNVTTGITDSPTTRTLVVNPPTGNRFYRLYKP